MQHSAGVWEPSPPSSLQRRTLGEARERPHSAPSSAPQHSHPQRGGRRRAPTAQPATPRAQDAHRSSSAQPGQKKAMKWFCSVQLSSAQQAKKTKTTNRWRQIVAHSVTPFKGSLAELPSEHKTTRLSAGLARKPQVKPELTKREKNKAQSSS